jgi:glycosyltransferase involved in cell wall biosynthesis
MPLVWQKHPEATLVIAGATPDYEIQKLKGEKIYITGWVDDIREYVAKSRIHLAPMFISIGMQNKILQAMAMKVPCIISTLSNNAIHAPENCVLIADTPEEYAERISYLLSDQEKAEAMAENAYNFVRANYEWKAAVGKLEKILTNTKIYH